MRTAIEEIFLNLIYLTPAGYLLSLLGLSSGEKTPGVHVQLSHNQPTIALVKKKPRAKDRVHWLLNGAALATQAAFIIYQDRGGSWGHIYAWIASIFGTVNITSAIIPKFDWQRRLPGPIRISAVELLVVTALIMTLVLADFFKNSHRLQ